MSNQSSDEFHLNWIHDRLVNVHGENENVDYMHRLKKIIKRKSELACGAGDDKPEWKAGELPPEGTKCEAIWEESPDGGELGWQQVTYKRGFDSKLWFSHNQTEIVIPAHCVTFRPIQSERDKVIEAALPHSNRTPRNFRSFAEDLYDAGMLTMPDKGEE